MRKETILSTTRQVNVKFLGDVLHVKYDLNKLTDDMRRKLREKDTTLEGFDYGLLTVLNSWDWNDENDKPLPITEEELSEMPYPLKMAIWEAILEDSNPKSLQKR